MALKAFTQQWAGNTCRVTGIPLPVGLTVYAENEDEVRNGLAVCAAVAFPDMPPAEDDQQPLPGGEEDAPELPDFDAMNRDQVVALAGEHYGMPVTGSTTKGAARAWILGALGIADDAESL